MSATMAIVHTSSQVEPQALRFQQPKLINTEKPKNRPQALQLAPFDAGELSKRLSVVVAEQDDDDVDPMSVMPPKSSKESPKNYQLKKDRSMSFGGSASPRSMPGKEPSPKTIVPKVVSVRKDSTSEAPVRRGSIFDRFNWKGSNFKEDEVQEKKAPAQPAYRHVPKHAASQFARTTTVETVSQKVTQVPKSAVSSASLGNPPISPMEYNNMYRRAQSLCSGRPYDRQLGVRETIAEVDEESSQPKNKYQGRGLTVNEPGGLRRKSTGTMNNRSYSRADVNIAMNQLRRDSTGMGSFPRRDSTGMSAYQRRDSQGSGGVRRDSASSNRSNSSNPFKDPPSNTTSKRRGSDRGDNGPLSPFKQEFEGVDPLRRGSDAIANSRRGSEARVDWSQSDEPAKKEPKGESKWNIKGRLGSISQRNIHDKEGKQELLVPNDPSPPMLSPISPKSGSSFLSKFKRQ